MAKQGRIVAPDHVIPPVFTQAMHANGQHMVAGAPLPKWRAQDSIDVMDLNGIQTSITSLSAPGGIPLTSPTSYRSGKGMQ